MYLTKFGDSTFLDYKGSWFVWEPCWESFRPVHAVRWDGSSFRMDLVEGSPLDPLYGYGSDAMKSVCDALTAQYAPQLDKAVPVQTPEIGPLLWFRDRRISMTACAPRDVASWKRMHRGKPRTCRHVVLKNKFTRRRQN